MNQASTSTPATASMLGERGHIDLISSNNLSSSNNSIDNNNNNTATTTHSNDPFRTFSPSRSLTSSMNRSNSLLRSPPPTGPSSARKFDPTRDSIIANSSKGWSPLQPKRQSTQILGSPTLSSSYSTIAEGDERDCTSPTAMAPNLTGGGPRRTSSSFKHVTGNSLVSNSPFKSGTTSSDGRSSMFPSSSSRESVLHIRAKSEHSVSPRKTSGILSGIGLGISASSPRRTSGSGGRKTSGTRSRSTSNSGSGKKRTSSSGEKSTPERRRVPSGERRVSGGALQTIDTPENQPRILPDEQEGHDSPDIQSSNTRKPRQSSGLKGLAKGALVTRSPFMQQNGTMDGLPDNTTSSSTPYRKSNQTIYASSPSNGASPMRFSSPRQPVVEDVFSSPSNGNPAVNGSMRRVSPIYKDRMAQGDLESPVRSRTGGSDENLVPFPSSSPEREKPLPLLQSQAYHQYSPDNNATPTKSSITKRRIHGPRLSGSESPTAVRQTKTVTFQMIPQVKEFETESVLEESEKSRDGYGSEGSESPEILQQEVGSRYTTGTMGGAFMIPDVNGRAVGELMELADEGYVDHASEDEHGGPPSSDQNHADESTTANFIDSLVEDGYFSPPSITSGSRMPDVMHVDEPVEETPVLNGFMDFTPKLDTPSFGSFGFSTPVVEQPPSLPTGIVLGAVIPPSASKDEVDGAGVPYGRTHHAQRAAEAHQVLHLPEEPIDQPALPKPSVMGGEPMIRSANVTQPALIPLNDRRVSHDRSSDVKAVQDGTFVDPFVTIRTATQVYMSTTETYSDQREEGGIPLGRTSHIERAKVARLMATQSLGLGLPNHPVQPSLPSTMRPGRRHISYGESEDGSEAEDSEGDDLDAIVQPPPIRQPANLSTPPKEERMSERRPPLSEKLEKLCSPVMGNAAKRTLPKPPQPRPLDIPSPKHAPTPEPENPVRSTSPTSNVFGVSLPFSLPSIGLTSPLFNSKAVESDTQSIDSVMQDTNKVTRPLTPPPATFAKEKKAESPHRIPDFDFESKLGKSFDMDVDMENSNDSLPQSMMRTSSTEPLRIIKRASTNALNTIPSPSKGEFGLLSKSSSDALSTLGGGSTTGRIRQRISKDMIRAKMEERKAIQSLARTNSDSETEEDTLIETNSKFMNRNDKALPAHPQDSGVRPQLRPRAQTRSAQDILEQVAREGTLVEPKSALDQLVSGFSDDASSSTPRPQSLIVRHVSSESVLTTQPARTGLPTVASSSLHPISEMATTDSAMTNDVTLAPVVTTMANRPRRRRSMSTGDARPQHSRADSSRMSVLSTLDDLNFKDDQSMLAAFESELKHISSDRAYRVREQHQTIYASSNDKVGHNAAGDVDSGKAWKQLRKASDMNQYAKELKALKSKGANKSLATIFVKVLGIESLALPLPKEETSFSITLDNTIDYIRTPYTVLKEGARVNQEFALVEHANFEFTLGLEIRRDEHIVRQLHANISRPLVPPSRIKEADAASTTSHMRNGGFRHLFSSPRKGSKTPKAVMAEVAQPVQKPQEINIGHYFPPGQSMIAKTHIAFKPIAKNCDSRLLEIRYPMFGHVRQSDAVQPGLVAKGDRPSSQPPAGTNASEPAPIRKQVCKITLQIFRLPPLPGLEPDQLPQSIDECLRGMRHHAWHGHEYHEGVLTQKGGDSNVPRRREFKVIGGNLVARNSVTKKIVFSIDLSKAVSVIDENDSSSSEVTGPSTPSRRSRDFDSNMGTMPRSFRLVFNDGEDILFWTDNDEEKSGWLRVLTSLIGKVPSNPLWAELLAARHRHAFARSHARKASVSVQGSDAASELSK